MKKTRLILAGGFLGAGKTTLLWEAANRLMRKGLRVGLITNDQAPELVDSALLTLNNLQVAEVSGSCFCCNFNGFTDAIQQIRADVAADVIIAEPVGSCTDLSATIIQPLKRYWNLDIEVSPLSVLADPSRLGMILEEGNAGLHEDAAYIFRKQLEESDVIVINKTDLLTAEQLAGLKRRTEQNYPDATVMAVSALTGEGIDAWLDEAMSRNNAGLRLAEVDYDIYANGEAVLGWLNGTVMLRSGKETDWDTFTRSYLAALSARFDEERMAVGHVKVIAENGKLFTVGNLTGTTDTLGMRSSAGSSDTAKLIINARVETTPALLNRIVRDTLADMTEGACETEVIAWKFLQPGRPQPTYRFAEVV